MNKFLFIVIILLNGFCGFAQKVKTPPVHVQPQIQFTENKNQWVDIISHRAQLDGGALFIEKSGKLTYHLYDKDNYRARHLGRIISADLKFHAYTIDFIGSNTSPIIVSNDMTKDYANFYIGKDPASWASNVHHYKTITVGGLYNGIDAVYSGGSQSIKYNFIVKPTGDPSQIKIQYTGLKNIKLKNGELYISTSVSESIEQKPFVFQVINGDTIEIPSKFLLQKDIVSFKLLSDYDHSKELIIDPLLVFAASSGSTADNFGMTATYDSRGNLYTGGTAFNMGYPTTVGAYDVSFNNTVAGGQTDVVITKYDSAGTFLKYSTYIGGNGAEIVTSLIVDKNDNLCLYGATGSTNFPTTVGCYDGTFNSGSYISFVFNGTTFNNGTDIYVSKLNSNGNTLLASTYIGGSENDGVNYNNAITSYTSPYGNVTEYPPDSLQYNYGDQYRGEIQVDSLDNIYIYSSTKSSDFPTVNAFDNTLGGKQDAILVKFTPTLSGLAFSTFIGGSDNDAGYALALDDTLNIYITGGTRSSDFPVTAGSYKTTYGAGKCDGYLCKIKQNGSSIMHATYIGTNSYDQSYFVQLDDQQDVYIYGQSLGNMPVTAGVYSNPNSKQFIQKLNPQLNNLLASTVFGNGNGNINISPSAFSVDCAGNIYLSGWGGNIIFLTPTLGMPLTSNAIQSSTDAYNFYLMVLAPNMTNILFGSYFGGALSHEHVDGGTSRFDKNGIIYQSVCAGCTNNDDFPVTPGAWPNTGSNVNHSGNCNNGVFKIDFQLNSAIASISTNTISGCVPLTVNFTNNSTPGHQYIWDFGSNDTTSVVFNPVKTFTAAGTYTANLYVKTSICNNLYDTATVTITVYPNPVAAFTSTSSLCSNTIATTNNSIGNLGSNPYVWNWGDGSPTSTLGAPIHTYATNGTFTVALTVTSLQGCVNKVIDTISVFNFTTSVTSATLCGGQTSYLYAQGGTGYTWQPAATVSNSLIANPLVSPASTTIYTVHITNNSAGYVCSKTLTTQVLVSPKPVADFTTTTDSCSNTISFINQTMPSSSLSEWAYTTSSVPSTTFSTNQNPTFVFNTAETYTLQLITVTPFGCRDTVLKPIIVPVSSVMIVPPQTKCYNEATYLYAYGGDTYSWQPLTGLTNPTSNLPMCTATASTIYTLTITQNSLLGNVCTKTFTTSVTVLPKITSAFNYTIGTCGNNVQFTDSSFTAPVNWLWSFGDVNTSPLQNTSHFYGSPGIYTVSLVVGNANGCKDTSKQIINLSGFVPIAVSPAVLQCDEDTVQLSASGGNYYLWQPAQYLSNPHISNPLAFPPTTTIYTVTIGTILGTDTCKSDLTTMVNVFPFTYNTNSISVSATTLTLGQSSTVTLSGFPYTTGTFTVVPNTNISVLTNTSIAVTPTRPGEYTVYFTDPNGCRHALKTIYIEVITTACNDGVVYLPTGFTPNNDGTNDILYIRSNFVAEVYLTIYDRWGEKLFETDDIKKGWDGTFKGKLLDQGVYGYYMTFKCNNGEESFKKGNITLMR
jgi:gliding motility-associated-like protein